MASKPTAAARMDALEAKLDALLDALTSKPAAPAAATNVHIGPSGKPDGRQFACTVDAACTALTRKAESADSHDPKSAYWHSPRS